jgi:hypothetical protein
LRSSECLSRSGRAPDIVLLVSMQPVDPREFTRLQQRLHGLFDRDAVADNSTVVVVPSVTLSSGELRKIPLAFHFEQRLFFLMQILRQPNTRVVYVTSQRLDRAVVDYALTLVSSLPPSSARRRLVLVECDDETLTPLTSKVLSRPDVINAILDAIPDPAHAYMVTFNTTPLERALALRLGIPLYGCDPDLSHLGAKSGGRKLLREAGVPLPEGFEDLRDMSDLVDALADLKTRKPDLAKAIIKLNDSFAGIGNAIFPYHGVPSSGIASWVAAQLPERLEFSSQGDSWDQYNSRFQEMGGIVEAFVDSPGKRSPSAQLEIRPGGDVHVLSTHEQILEGTRNQTFTGCAFPARQRYRLRVQELAFRVGNLLARKGVIGQLSVDFVVDCDTSEDTVQALEINLRMGGATAPYFLLAGLTEGQYDTYTGNYLTPEGNPRYYYTRDRVQHDDFRVFRVDDVVDVAFRHGLHYSHATRTGAAFYALGSLTDLGRLGIIGIDSSPDRAQELYTRMVEGLKRESALVNRAVRNSEPTGMRLG